MPRRGRDSSHDSSRGDDRLSTVPSQASFTYDEEHVDPDHDRTFRFFYMLAGPLRYMTISPALFLLLCLSIIVLTVTSQVYGVILWLALPFFDALHAKVERVGGRFAALMATALVTGLTFVIVNQALIPPLAKLAGRVPLPCSYAEDQPLRPASRIGCFFNRHYAVPALRDKAFRLAEATAKATRGRQATIYLDAAFPFFPWFPMLPHLSHADGRKLDLAFAWSVKRAGDDDVRIPSGPPTPIGYWYYEQPQRGENQPCKSVDSWLRWDMPWIQKRYAGHRWDEERTSSAIAWLIADDEGVPVRRILLEPHLTARLGLDTDKVRFQGCQAARHDDHYHIEI